MITLSAKWVAEELLSLLSDQEYKVHSVFDNGFNLQVGDVLCYIGNKYDMKLPYAIILEGAEIRKMSRIQNLPETNFSWDEQQKCFTSDESGRIMISVQAGMEYSSKLTSEHISDREKAVREICSVIEPSHGVAVPTEELLQVLRSNCAEDIRNVLKRVVGYGQGLTPSGDDFLMGILYTYQLLGIEVSHTFLDTLTDMVNHGYTTDTSVHYYRCAMRGMFSEPLLELAGALVNPDGKMQLLHTVPSRERARQSIEKLLTFGHTSGKDTAAGILAAARHVENCLL